MDDMPIGGGDKTMQAATSSSDQADNTGPLEKRIVSKNWKTRADAYDELSALCENAKVDSKEPFFSEYVIMWKEILKDSNPGALEKALACLEKFLSKCRSAVILDYQNNILNSLIEKCFGHAKPVIKQKAVECFLLLFECSENFEICIDTLIALASNKNLKIQIGGTQGIALLVENFGVKKIKIQLYAEMMIKNAQNTNPEVKKATYDYYKAVYKWIGDVIKPQIEGKLKPIQIEELQKLFDEVKASGNKNKRVVRSEKAMEEEMKKNALIDAAMAEEKKAEEEAIDPLEFAPEVDILVQFNVEWQENTAGIKKWDEKVQKLNDLINACKNVKIKPGNFENLSQLLKKEINATHVSINASAIEASTYLAIGLKKQFQPYIKHLMNPVLLKFKEKKQVVIDKINGFLDASLQCTDLEQIKEDIIVGLTNAAPLVKLGTVKFLEKAAVITYIDVLQRIQDDILPPMLKAVDDKDSGVRDAALHCVGILKGRYGEAIMSKFLKGIDNKQKLDKIEEGFKEVKPSKFDRPENWKPPAPKKVVEKKKANDEDELMNFDQKPKKAPPKNIGQKPKPKVEEDQIMEPAQNDEDQLMTFENVPKKAPPKNIGIKPKKKEDEEMKVEESAAPKKVAAAPSQAKPKAAPSSGSSKPPSAPVIEEEDLGSGLSKEEACNKVQEFFNSQTVELFDKDKWQDKKQGFEELEKEIIEKQPDLVTLEAVAKFVKTKMKDWKESNINLQKAIVSIFDCIVTNSERINKRTIQCAMSYFIDKIGDVKMQESIKTMLMTAAELVTPKFLSLQIIKYAATAKSPNNLTQSCVVLTDIVEDFGVGGIPLKETIDYGKLATAHATPAVRQAAMKLFCSIYKQVGEVIKNFTNDIKESTQKMIYDEFEKITVYKKGEFQKKRSVRGEAAEQEQAQIGAKKGKGAAADDDILGSLPREDITKKLTSKLMEQFKNKDWKIRKKGGDDVEAILREAKMRIEINGLGELMENIKLLMKDPNKAVVKVFITLLGLLADAIGSPIKLYTKKCFVPMLNNLSDKQSLVRQDVIVTMNKWAEAIGADQIINNISPNLLVENPEFRQEGLNWIMQNTSALQTCDHQQLLKPLISCLLDKSKEIRTKTEEIISLVMPILGYQDFLNATKDKQPAVQQTLKIALEKIKSQCNAGQGPAPQNGGAPKEENDELKSTINNNAANNKKNVSQTLPVQTQKVAQANQVINSFERLALEKKQAQEKKIQEKKGGETVRESQAPKQTQRIVGNDDDEVRITPLNKNKRAQQDGRSKYPIFEVKGDHIEKLQSMCNEIFGQKFADLMFAKSVDFQKHIKCVDALDKIISTQYDQIVDVLDIIFKWCVLKMNESNNTTLLLRIFDFYGNLINQLAENQYKMQEFEMIILISTVCEKNGHNNQIIKEKSRKLTKLCYEIYDKKALYRLIVEIGVKQKNLKAVSECLEELSDYIQQNGVDSVTKKDFDLFLKTVDNADKSVRESSLKVFAESYTILGEGIWDLLSKDMPLKVKNLLEARFKTVGKKSGGMNLDASMRSNGMNSSAMKTNQQKELNLTNNSGRKTLQKSIGSLQFKKPVQGQNKLDKSMKSDNQISGGSIPDEQPQEQDFQTINQVLQKFEPKSEMKSKAKPLSPLKNNAPVDLKEQFYPQQAIEDQNQMQRDFNKQDQDMIEEQKLQEDDQSILLSEQKRQLKQEIEENPQEQRRMNTQNLEQALNEAENKLELDVDPELRKQSQFILGHINQLKNGDLLKRVDSLVALNEVISGLGNQNQSEPQNNSESVLQQKALIKCCDDLIHAFSQVMNDIFNYPVQEIPLRFTKYFITIVNKTCSQKEIMREVSYQQVSSLVEQLLTRLLIDNLDKIGQNKEGELILKNLNSSMLRMLENCSHTFIFVVLFELLTKYKDDQNNQKVPSLIIKCLLKLSKNMEKIIEKIDLKRFLVAIHEYLASIGANRSNNDDLGMRIAKTLVNEIVKLKKEAIWKFFEVIEKHQKPDLHLKKWIQIILRSLQDGNRPSTSQTYQAPSQQILNANNDQSQQENRNTQSRMYVEFEIKKIILELKDPQKYENALQKLDKFSKNNPDYDFTKNLQKESNEFAQQVKFDLNQLRNSQSNISTNNTSGGLAGTQNLQDQFKKLNQVQSTSNIQNVFNAHRQSNVQQTVQDLNTSLSKQSAFQSKMAQFQKRQSNIVGLPPQGNQNLSMSNNAQIISQPAAQNLNTSFSDLNQKLSNQWANIQNSNKKTGQFTGRPTTTQTTTQLAQTINVGQTGIRNSVFVGQSSSNLNTSNNQFKNRLMQGNLASRLQTKVNNNDSLGGEETGIIGQKNHGTQEQNAEQSRIQSLNKSSNVNNAGGISNNSFRNRIQGFQKGSNQNSQATEGTQAAQSKNSQQPATNIDLQKRLAEMKAKLQVLKKE